MPTPTTTALLVALLVSAAACDSTAEREQAFASSTTLTGEPAETYGPGGPGGAGYAAFPGPSGSTFRIDINGPSATSVRGYRLRLDLRAEPEVGASYEIGLGPVDVLLSGEVQGEGEPPPARLTLEGGAVRNGRPLVYSATSGTLEVTALSDSTIGGRFSADLVRDQNRLQNGRFTPVLGRAEGTFYAEEYRIVLLSE